MFTTDDIDGVISAALYHAKARQISGGICTSFGSGKDSCNDIKILHALIRLGMSQQVALPDTRLVMVVGLHGEIHEELTFEDVSTSKHRVIRLDRSHYRPNFLLRPILRLSARLLTRFHDNEEAAIILSQWMLLF